MNERLRLKSDAIQIKLRWWTFALTNMRAAIQIFMNSNSLLIKYD